MDKLRVYKDNFHKLGKSLHFNNAGLSPISLPAKNKINYWADRFYKEGFESDLDYMEDVIHSRTSLSKLIGCDPSEIAFFQSTASAISQLCFQFPLQKGDEVLTWDQEYGSNLYPWQEACFRADAKLIQVQSEKDFSTLSEKIIEQINSKTKVIAISWVQFQTGARTDLKKLSEQIKDKNIFLFIDVMQGLGLHPFNMKDFGVDAVAGGSHKWLTSPVGVGFLALDQKHIGRIRPHNIGSSTYGTCDDPADLICAPKKNALKFEPGSKQVLEITALGASVDLILSTGISTIEAETLRLSGKLAAGLRHKGFTAFHHQSSIVNFVPTENSAQELLQIHCSFARRGPGLRLSSHAFNTDEEIEKILTALSGK